MYKHMAKVVIKILQGSTVTQTMLGGLTIISRLTISSSVCVPKILKIGRQWTKLWQKLAGILFFGPPCTHTTYGT